MEQYGRKHKRNPLVRLVLVTIFTIFFAVPIFACTIFVLADGRQMLFCNNEDWTNPATRIWFVPAGKEYYGCVYVGYKDGWARGGMNTEGLACDWVGGFSEGWRGDAVTGVRGNPTERLLESCATIEEAVAFFQCHKEPDFSRSKILVADRTGKSVVLGARDGKLQIDRSERSRSFGYAFQTARACLAKDPAITAANGASILHACLQEGQYATKYSNIFDLKSGDIYLFQFHQHVDSMQMNLGVELARGGHYFDMVQIHRQFSGPVMPLPMNMRRFVIDDFPPISDPEPDITHHIRTMVKDAIAGTMHAEDYHAEFWSSISPVQKAIQDDLKRFGKLQSVALVQYTIGGNRRINRYRVDFEKLRSLMRFELDDHKKVVSLQSEATERKPGADLEE